MEASKKSRLALLILGSRIPSWQISRITHNGAIKLQCPHF